MKHLILICVITLSSDLFSQNIGINNVDPQTSLDINGSLRLRPTNITPVANVINVPDNVGYLVINSGCTGLISINANSTHIGRRLIIDHTASGCPAILGVTFTNVPVGSITEYIVAATQAGWTKLNNTVPNPLYLSGTATTITGETSSQEEVGVLGKNTSNELAIGVKGIVVATNPTDQTIAVLGENGSQNSFGFGVAGYHYGSGWAGYFSGTNALKANGTSDLGGNVTISGEIKPNGASGSANQVLTSNGNGTMQWAEIQNNGDESVGSGAWGDCSVNGITAFQPVANDNGETVDFFGNSVSIAGDYAIVGAPGDDEGAGLSSNGSASIFKRNSTSGVWEFQVKLVDPNAATGDIFGISVAISGDYAIIGASYDDEGAGLTDNGSASIFKRNTTSGVWEYQVKLVNQNAGSSDNFGISVAISGDYAIVGAFRDDEGAGLTDNGSVSIFKRNATSGVWEFQVKLVDPSAATADAFGNSVAISGDNVIIGAPVDDEGTGLTDNGSVSIFKRNTTSGVWEFQIKLVNQNAASSERFGASVAISVDNAIVGAWGDDEGAGLTDNGSASIFKRNTTSGVWEYQVKLVNQNAASSDNFGISVAISGDYAIIGAQSDDEGAGLTDNGSASIYKRYGNIWQLVQKFTHPNSVNSVTGDQFGAGIAIDGMNRRFLVGAAGAQSQMGMAFFGKVK